MSKRAWLRMGWVVAVGWSGLAWACGQDFIPQENPEAVFRALVPSRIAFIDVPLWAGIALILNRFLLPGLWAEREDGGSRARQAGWWAAAIGSVGLIALYWARAPLLALDLEHAEARHCDFDPFVAQVLWVAPVMLLVAQAFVFQRFGEGWLEEGRRFEFALVGSAVVLAVSFSAVRSTRLLPALFTCRDGRTASGLADGPPYLGRQPGAYQKKCMRNFEESSADE